MKKKWLPIVALSMAILLTTPAFAGQWRADSTGWWYQENNGSYPRNTWKAIDGSWYYFYSNGYMAHDTWINGLYYVGSDGRMLANTITPDGYLVGADGKWASTTVRDDYWLKHYNEGFNNLIMNKNMLIDHGSYYELKGQEMTNYYRTYAEAEAERQTIASKDRYYIDIIETGEGDDYFGPTYYCVRPRQVNETYASWRGSVYIYKDAIVNGKYTFSQYLRQNNYRERAVILGVDGNGFITSITTELAG